MVMSSRTCLTSYVGPETTFVKKKSAFTKITYVIKTLFILKCEINTMFLDT